MEKRNKSLILGLYTCKLLNAIINNQPSPDLPKEITPQELYEFQLSQSVANMAYWGLKDLSLTLQELKPFEDEYKMTLLREARFEIAGTQVAIELEKNNIPFIPLKGMILKKFYNTEAFRSFTDFDIYVGDNLKQVQPVMEGLGFKVESVSDYDVHFVKKPSISFEMHKNFFSESYNFNGYFDKPFEKAVLKPDSSCYYMLKNEDFYIQVFCHLFKHFAFGGCGIRQFMDIYVMDKKLSLDRDYIKAEMESLDLLDFYNRVQQLLQVMFKGEKADKESLEICQYIFNNGTFGTEQNFSLSLRKEEDRKKSFLLWKISFFVNRWGLSYSNMKKQYKVLEKIPVLLPFCWFHKGFKVLFFKRDVLKSQVEDIEAYNNDYAEYIDHIKKISGVKL